MIKPWFTTQQALGWQGHGGLTCTCCERDLAGHAIRMLELDQRSGTYHDLGDVPEDRSQGWFPFGLTCARKLVAKETKRRVSPSLPRPQRGGNCCHGSTTRACTAWTSAYVHDRKLARWPST